MHEEIPDYERLYRILTDELHILKKISNNRDTETQELIRTLRSISHIKHSIMVLFNDLHDLKRTVYKAKMQNDPEIRNKLNKEIVNMRNNLLKGMNKLYKDTQRRLKMEKKEINLEKYVHYFVKKGIKEIKKIDI